MCRQRLTVAVSLWLVHDLLVLASEPGRSGALRVRQVVVGDAFDRLVATVVMNNRLRMNKNVQISCFFLDDNVEPEVQVD